MSGLNLDVAAAQASSKTISGIVEQMHSVLRQVQNSAQSGLATWSGQASRSYDATQNDWSVTAAKLQAALNDIEAQLTTGFRGYDEHDAGNASAITSSGGLTI
ncbi:WXG100 family type VII secretion target [Gordonia sp. CPCC 206044]|uniref:WXG100 family type VII secretion target n=1 Tax=Gordonia sp. CPCC 206044 TaxID=3140793 RepID=UPI003AF37278